MSSGALRPEGRKGVIGEVPHEAESPLERTGEWIEILIYLAGGFFLVAASVIVLADAVPALWRGASPWSRATLILDRVLLVFVLVEVLHTVRFVVTRHRLRAEPFLIVALIAGVRRVLVVTAGTQPLARREDLVELGLLILLLVASAGALFLLGYRPAGASSS
ncbi:MAG TPA: phosphate-starvation-inducible PsiE family protein [Candidatus Dormibacteraeota bacterium]